MMFNAVTRTLFFAAILTSTLAAPAAKTASKASGGASKPSTFSSITGGASKAEIGDAANMIASHATTALLSKFDKPKAARDDGFEVEARAAKAPSSGAKKSSTFSSITGGASKAEIGDAANMIASHATTALLSEFDKPKAAREFEFELEARDFEDYLEARYFEDLEFRDYEDLEFRDYEDFLEYDA